MGSAHRRSGAGAERVVASLLAARGCRVITRNLRVGPDEVDLVVDDAAIVVAVEVKSTMRPGVDPLDAVDEAKLQRLRRALSRADLAAGRVDLVGLTIADGGIEFRRLVDVVD